MARYKHRKTAIDEVIQPIHDTTKAVIGIGGAVIGTGIALAGLGMTAGLMRGMIHP